MMEINKLLEAAIFLIYPDGLIEYIIEDNINFLHKEYFIVLRNANSRLKLLVEKQNIPIPTVFDIYKNTDTYDIDLALAHNGVIALHNYWNYDFNITLPSELTDKQREIMKKISNEYNLSSSSYSRLIGNELKDIEYPDFINMLGKQKKS